MINDIISWIKIEIISSHWKNVFISNIDNESPRICQYVWKTKVYFSHFNETSLHQCSFYIYNFFSSYSSFFIFFFFNKKWLRLYTGGEKWSSKFSVYRRKPLSLYDSCLENDVESMKTTECSIPLTVHDETDDSSSIWGSISLKAFRLFFRSVRERTPPFSFQTTKNWSLVLG